MHLKSVQKTMMVSNMQKWMPAFRRLEAKFASSNMTDAEKIRVARQARAEWWAKKKEAAAKREESEAKHRRR